MFTHIDNRRTTVYLSVLTQKDEQNRGLLTLQINKIKLDYNLRKVRVEL